MKPRQFVVSLFAYVVLANIVLTLLTPLRVLQVFDAAYLRNLVLPFVLVFIVVSAGFSTCLKCRPGIQTTLLLGLIQAALVGIVNLTGEDAIRPYFSHIFQLGSAYAMLGVGFVCAYVVPDKSWVWWSYLSLAASAVATATILFYMSSVGIGRLYTPAYGLFLPVAYLSMVAPMGNMGPLLLLVVSNKRGPIVSVVVMLAAHLMFGSSRIGALNARVRKNVTNLLAICAALAIVGIVVRSASISQDEGILSSAINITFGRLEAFLNFGSRRFDLDQASSGRVSEIAAAIETIQWYTPLCGNGAGSTFGVSENGGRVQNIHVTPISVAIIFGIPFAVALYFSICVLMYRTIVRLRVDKTAGLSVRIAPYYCIAAITHTLFAYSLFIDLFTFFFLGVMTRYLSDSKGNGVLKA